MTNSYVPLEGRLVHLSFEEAEKLAYQPLQGKILPAAGNKQAHMMHGPVGAGKSTLARTLYASLPDHTRRSTVYIGSDEHGAMDSIAAYREGITGADAGTRHQLWQMYQNDADYIRSRTLDLAIGAGLSVFLDTTGGGSKGLQTVSILGNENYPVTVSSCWAPLPVCAKRIEGRERQADPAYLLTKRLGAYESFLPLTSMVRTMNIYYSSAADLAPGMVISIMRTGLLDTPLKTTTIHPNLLSRMIRDMKLEGCGDWMNALHDKALASREDHVALITGGNSLSTYLQRVGAGHLVPAQQGPLRVL